MKKLSLESLNNLFEFLQNQTEAVLWIRSRSYERQLFVSPNFDNLWGYSSQALYENPAAFDTFLVPDDRNVAREMIEHDESGQEHVSYLYRIQKPSGEIKYIKDWHYLLTDEKDYIVGIAGIAQVIDKVSWESELVEKQKTLQNQTSFQLLQQHIFRTLKNELHINSQSISHNSPKLAFGWIKDKKGKNVELTSRESECLSYVMQGKSAKQTGAILNISQRTVEFHLDNIKQKAQCRTKLELLGQVKSTRVS